MSINARCQQLSRNRLCSSKLCFRSRTRLSSRPRVIDGLHRQLFSSVPTERKSTASALTVSDHNDFSTSRDCDVPAPAAPEGWTGYLPNCRGVAVISLPGKQNGRPKLTGNQDAVLTHTVQPTPLCQTASVLGVFDGHGRAGHIASARVKETMASVLEHCARHALAGNSKPWHFSASNLGSASALSTGAAAVDFTAESALKCLEETFARTAETMVSATEFAQSGSTAVVCMLLQDSIVAAWAGDSRAVMGVASGNCYRATELTKDHKPNDISEMSRIMAAGGKVAQVANNKEGMPTGPFRVFLPIPVSPGLSVARAFGDTLLSQAGVIPTPDFTIFPLINPAALSEVSNKPSHVLILASDGLWQFIDSQTAVDIAAGAASAEEAAHLLLNAAKQSWEDVYGGKHQDDISIAVAFL